MVILINRKNILHIIKSANNPLASTNKDSQRSLKMAYINVIITDEETQGNIHITICALNTQYSKYEMPVIRVWHNKQIKNLNNGTLNVFHGGNLNRFKYLFQSPFISVCILVRENQLQLLLLYHTQPFVQEIPERPAWHLETRI